MKRKLICFILNKKRTAYYSVDLVDLVLLIISRFLVKRIFCNKWLNEGGVGAPRVNGIPPRVFATNGWMREGWWLPGSMELLPGFLRDFWVKKQSCFKPFLWKKNIFFDKQHILFNKISVCQFLKLVRPQSSLNKWVRIYYKHV